MKIGPAVPPSVDAPGVPTSSAERLQAAAARSTTLDAKRILERPKGLSARLTACPSMKV
jgi:hypothetical protein